VKLRRLGGGELKNATCHGRDPRNLLVVVPSGAAGGLLEPAGT
jgi:hypothetical protein